MSEPGWLVLESSTRISGYFAPTDSEHKFNKTENENWLPLGYNLGSSWLGTRSHNHYTMFTHWWGDSSRFIYPSIKSWNDPGNISLLWKCASVPKPPIHHPEYTVQKMKFSIKDFFSKCEEILHGKLHFFCSGSINPQWNKNQTPLA